VVGLLAKRRGLGRFLRLALKLKSTPRMGWLDRGVPAAEVESVAAHSFQTALLAWLAAAADPTLDRDRILKLALIHDLPEAIIGDWTPYDRHDIPDSNSDRAAWRAFFDRRHIRSASGQAEKKAAERDALNVMLADLTGNARVELAALWHELNEGLTAEARFVKQADSLEAYLQSRAYLETDAERPMASFAAEIEETLNHPALIALREAAKADSPS
ncbi:MAG: HD domain-containing protein, partial [Thermomicrobiales bacterium]